MNSVVEIELAGLRFPHHFNLGNGIVLSPMNLSEHSLNALLNLCAGLNFLVVRLASASFSESEPDLDE
jgi:hypothetical protein